MAKTKTFKTYYSKVLNLRLNLESGGVAQFAIGKYKTGLEATQQAIEAAPGFGEAFWYAGF